ncbi:hypothetical protein Tco_0286079 [Tanacetum coccineum]
MIDYAVNFTVMHWMLERLIFKDLVNEVVLGEASHGDISGNTDIVKNQETVMAIGNDQLIECIALDLRGHVPYASLYIPQKGPELLSGNDVLWTFRKFAGEDHTNVQTLVVFLKTLSTQVGNCDKKPQTAGRFKRGCSFISSIGMFFLDLLAYLRVAKVLDLNTVTMVDMLMELTRREKIAVIRPEEKRFMFIKRALALGGHETALVVEYILKGHIVYQGPRNVALDFFTFMGFQCPQRKNVADFLQEDQEQYCSVPERDYRYIPVKKFTVTFRSY